MLIQFSVENYRCFRDRVTLSMVPASADKSHWAERVVSSAHGTKMNVLKAAAILGANASGKSTLIHAIRFMKDFVAGSSRERLKDSPTGVTPFRLDAQHAAKPSKFEAVFLQDSIRWVYGFAVDSQRVVEEHLSNYPVRGERVLFTRKLDGKGKTAEFYFGPSWGGPAKALRELTRENALLLSVGAQMKSPIAERVYDWFTKVLREVSWFPTAGGEFAFTSMAARNDDGLRTRFRRFLQQADLGIADFSVRQVPLAESRTWLQLPETVRRNFAERTPPDATDLDVRTTHLLADDPRKQRSVEFPLEDESDGTQKLYALAGPLLFVLDHGCTVAVDELDARLHPLLTQWVVGLFQRSESNPKGAQIIFTAHDASLLERGLLRRDQVWLTEKDAQGSSELYSLWDFEKPPRQQENLRRGYLAGRYGAVPIPGRHVP